MHGDTFGSRTISRESSYTINSMQPSYIFICIVILYGEHTSVIMCPADMYIGQSRENGSGSGSGWKEDDISHRK